MSKDKQIEEMANDYYEAMLKARGMLGSMNEGAPKWYAKELYAKGYRKSTDLAEEIFAEIGELINEYLEGRSYRHEFIKKIHELKKKYTEEGK